jgi:hypothetical protein
MKTKIARLFLLGVACAALQGCVAIPPLIQVQHKEAAVSNDEVMKRLDSIDRRLDRLERGGNPPAQSMPR